MRVLLAAGLVHEALGAGLLVVGNGLTAYLSQYMVGGDGKIGGVSAYRWNLSVVSVKPSLTLSVVDLEFSGVIFSCISAVRLSA